MGYLLFKLISGYVRCVLWKKHVLNCMSKLFRFVHFISNNQLQWLKYGHDRCDLPMIRGTIILVTTLSSSHDDVIKWKHFPCNWPFVRGIHRSPVNSPHKGQWRGALMFSLICARIKGGVNNGEAGDLRHNHAHNDVIVMVKSPQLTWRSSINGWNLRYRIYNLATFILTWCDITR